MCFRRIQRPNLKPAVPSMSSLSSTSPAAPPPAIPQFQLSCCDGHSWAGSSWRSFGDTYCTDAGFHANCVTNASCGGWEGDCDGYYCSSYSGSAAPCASWASGVCNACRQCFNHGCSYYDAWVAPPAAPSPSSPPIITIDPAVQRAVGGVRELERTKWFNIHADPQEAEWTADDIATFAGTYRATMGRGFTISSRMKPWAAVATDPTRPGYVDHAALVESCRRFPNSNGAWPLEAVDMITSSKAEQLYANGCEHETNGPGSFIPGSADATADFYSVFVAHCMKPSLASRALIEVANECDVKYKTNWRVGCNVSWAGMIELHQVIARRLHADAAAGAYAVQPVVCGPTSAWPEFQMNDFENFETVMAPFIRQVCTQSQSLSRNTISTRAHTWYSRHSARPRSPIV